MQAKKNLNNKKGVS